MLISYLTPDSLKQNKCIKGSSTQFTNTLPCTHCQENHKILQWIATSYPGRSALVAFCFESQTNNIWQEEMDDERFLLFHFVNLSSSDYGLAAVVTVCLVFNAQYSLNLRLSQCIRQSIDRDCLCSGCIYITSNRSSYCGRRRECHVSPFAKVVTWIFIDVNNCTDLC